MYPALMEKRKGGREGGRGKREGGKRDGERRMGKEGRCQDWEQLKRMVRREREGINIIHLHAI